MDRSVCVLMIAVTVRGIIGKSTTPARATLTRTGPSQLRLPRLEASVRETSLNLP